MKKRYFLTVAFIALLASLPLVTFAQESGLASAALLENRGFSLALVVLAGLVDGVNVCGIALMMLLVGYLLVFVKDRKRSMKIGGIFLLTILIMYFIGGAFLASVVQSLINWEHYQVFAVALNYTLVGLLALAGLLNLQDFFFNKKFVFEVGTAQRRMFREYLKKVDVPGTVGLGVLATLFLLPCSLPIYLASVGKVAQVFPYWQTLGYVFVYALFFVLPLLIVMAILLRIEKVFSEKEIRSERFKWLKLVKGILQILIALGLYFL